MFGQFFLAINIGERRNIINNELTIIQGTRIALFRSSGSVEFNVRKGNIERMAQFCSEHSINHLIVDIREQVSNANTIQMFNIGAMVPNVMSGIQIAVVCHSSDYQSKFGETVAANRGAFSSSFTTIEEAQRWLEGKDEVGPREYESNDE
jgi:hypothetical protein